jgi:hypothetical protein
MIRCSLLKKENIPKKKIMYEKAPIIVARMKIMIGTKES